MLRSIAIATTEAAVFEVTLAVATRNKLTCFNTTGDKVIFSLVRHTLREVKISILVALSLSVSVEFDGNTRWLNKIRSEFIEGFESLSIKIVVVSNDHTRYVVQDFIVEDRGQLNALFGDVSKFLFCYLKCFIIVSSLACSNDNFFAFDSIRVDIKDNGTCCIGFAKCYFSFSLFVEESNCGTLNEFIVISAVDLGCESHRYSFHNRLIVDFWERSLCFRDVNVLHAEDGGH